MKRKTQTLNEVEVLRALWMDFKTKHPEEAQEFEREFIEAERRRWEEVQAVWNNPAGLLELVADRSRSSMTRLMACNRLKEVGDASMIERLQELLENEMDPAVCEELLLLRKRWKS
jgi:hypothetical protein